MKNLILIIALASSLQCLAQDPQLFDNTWYLHDLIIDGNSNPPPSNSEVPFVDLIFDENPTDNLTTRVCFIGTGQLTFDDPNSSFSFPAGMDVGGLLCDDQGNVEFEGIYFNFYLDEIDFPFVYEVSFSNGNFFLTITSQSGDQAMYGDQILAVNDQELISVGLYPNPVDNVLTLTSPRNEILSIHIYNMEGKQISSFKMMNQNLNEVSLVNLESGIYFVKIITDVGQVTKKIIKE